VVKPRRRISRALVVASTLLFGTLALAHPPALNAAGVRWTPRLVSSAYYAGAQFDGSGADGARVFFSTSDRVLPDDIDSAISVYRDDAGTLTLMSPSGPFDAGHEFFDGASANGAAVVFSAFDPLAPNDTDPGSDLYAYVAGDIAPVLVTEGPGTGTFRAISDDGSRVLFDSSTSFVPSDTDTALDLYLWDDGVIRLVSGVTPSGPSAQAPASIVAFADDVQIVDFGSPSVLVPGAPATGATYEWRIDGSLRARVADPSIGGPHLSPDGGTLAFWSSRGLVGADTNGTGDAYLEDGSLHLLSDGTTVDQTADVAALLVDGDIWALVETSEALVPADVDGHVDLYRWTKSTGSYELGTTGSGPLDAWYEGGSAAGAVVVRTAEALDATDTDGAEDLYLLRPGGTHSVLVSSATVNDQPVFDAVSSQGDRVLFSTTAALDPSDVDGGKLDIFDFHDGTTTSVGGPASDRDVIFRSASGDATLVGFSTGSSLVPEDDVPNSGDVYLATISPPETVVAQVLPLITPSQEATVTFGSPSGVRFECRLDGVSWSACVSPLHLTGVPEGQHTIEVRAWDRAGFVDPTPGSQPWVVDLTGPAGSVSINDGASTAARWIVRVAIPATDPHNIIAARLSSSPATTNQCAGGCATLDAAYEVAAPGPDVAFDLSRAQFGGSLAEGGRSVYVQWQDGVGNWSPVASDSIVVDRSVDVPTSVTVAALTNPAPIGGSSYLKATVTAADGTPVNTGTIQFTGGGVSSVQYPVAGGVAYHWQEAWTAGTHVVTATYSGAEDLASSAGSVTQAVGSSAIAPTVTAPAARVDAGAVAESPNVPISIEWTGSDPVPGVRVLRYELRQSLDAGPSTLISARLLSSTARASVPSGHTVRFLVRAFDRAGNASPWASGPILQVGVVSEVDAALTYHGTWTTPASSSYYGGHARASSQPGATATYRFTGRSVGWLTALSAVRGKATILVDGVAVQTIDLQASTSRTRVLAFVKSWSSSGTHTITVRVLGTTGRPRIDVDGFVTLR
jgi:hypothetical protein